MTPLDIRIRRLPGNDLPLPEYATPLASGMDLRAAEDVTLEPGRRVAVPTGFALAIPEGYEGQVRMRSGLALRHGLVVPNSPGTIDHCFAGELKVIVMNLGDEPFRISRGDRIAQLVIQPVVQARWTEVEALPPSERGEGGFGHTGVR
jgi:dUTP diphosphatase